METYEAIIPTIKYINVNLKKIQSNYEQWSLRYTTAYPKASTYISYIER